MLGRVGHIQTSNAGQGCAREWNGWVDKGRKKRAQFAHSTEHGHLILTDQLIEGGQGQHLTQAHGVNHTTAHRDSPTMTLYTPSLYHVTSHTSSSPLPFVCSYHPLHHSLPFLFLLSSCPPSLPSPPFPFRLLFAWQCSSFLCVHERHGLVDERRCAGTGVGSCRG
jgi:hypothetical protein